MPRGGRVKLERGGDMNSEDFMRHLAEVLIEAVIIEKTADLEDLLKRIRRNGFRLYLELLVSILPVVDQDYQNDPPTTNTLEVGEGAYGSDKPELKLNDTDRRFLKAARIFPD